MSRPARFHDSDSNDGAIVAAVLAGKKERFALLVSRYEKPLLRLARSRLPNEAWAEEAVQETFLSAYKWLQSYDSRYSFRTWLWTILLNRCARIAKRNGRRPRVSVWADYEPPAHGASSSGCGAPPDFTSSGHPATSPPHPVCEQPGPGEQAVLHEKSEQLQKLLQQLPDRQADALRLRFYGGLKFQEIADAMACSLSTAKNRVRAGLEALSELLLATSSVEAFPNRSSEPPSKR